MACFYIKNDAMCLPLIKLWCVHFCSVLGLISLLCLLVWFRLFLWQLSNHNINTLGALATQSEIQLWPFVYRGSNPVQPAKPAQGPAITHTAAWYSSEQLADLFLVQMVSAGNSTVPALETLLSASLESQHEIWNHEPGKMNCFKTRTHNKSLSQSVSLHLHTPRFKCQHTFL